MVKYFLEYTDTVGTPHRLDISNTAFTGSETRIEGSVYLDYASTTDTLEAIRGKGLKIELEANTALTFSDLYTEVDRTFSVIYKRDNVVLFNGWLDSEGFFEDFVSDKWIVSLDCVDGLGYLSDLSYVDTSGAPFSGKQSLIKIISNCLIRTGVLQDINTSVDIYYTGLATTLDVFSNVYFNADRFVKDDNSTIMSCEEVLRSVLEPFAACLVAHNGEWYIFKPNQIFNSSTISYFNYDSDGVFVTTSSLALYKSLGSEIDGFEFSHISSNQKIENDKSIGAYRISYKYGFATSLNTNPNLCSDNGTTLLGWTILSGTNIVIPSAGTCGVKFQLYNGQTQEAKLESSGVSVLLDQRLDIEILTYKSPLTLLNPKIVFQVILDDLDSANFKYLDNAGVWQTSSSTKITKPIETGNFSLTIQTAPSIYTNGDVIVKLWQPTADQTTDIFIDRVNIVASSDTPASVLKGEFHTFQREDSPSANVRDVKKVATGDSPLDTYDGTIYKNDAVTPTETWFREGITESKPILQIMGEETLRMNPQVKRIFSGDIFGYIPYFSLISINNITGKFMPISYSYNTKMNIISLTSKQIYGNELTDIAYEKTFDYGNTVKPTIKG